MGDDICTVILKYGSPNRMGTVRHMQLPDGTDYLIWSVMPDVEGGTVVTFRWTGKHWRAWLVE